jgi:ParB/RepB/Spo0J family partition protein
LIQPIAVRPKASGRYQVVAGHRRVAAFRLLRDRASGAEERKKFASIRAQVLLALDDSQMAVGAYVENVQRADLNPVEEAAALARIRELTGAKTTKDIAAVTGQNDQRVRRLLRLDESPAVIKEGVTVGLLVPIATTSSGDEKPRERREHRRLDLLAAIEFIRLHDHWFKKKPKAAEERTGAAIRRALGEGWGFRRIQAFVEDALAGHEATVTEDNGAGPILLSPLYEQDERRFVFHFTRMPKAPVEQLVMARAELQRLMGEVQSHLQGRPSSPVPTENQR